MRDRLVITKAVIDAVDNDNLTEITKYLRLGKIQIELLLDIRELILLQTAK